MRVLVLEARELVGGCAVTEEIWPGYRVSTAAYLASLMQEKVVRDLEPSASVIASTPRTRRSFPPFPTGATCSCGRIARKPWLKSPSSRGTTPRRIRATKRTWKKLAMVAESVLLTTPPDFPPHGIGDFIEYLKLVGRLRGLSRAEIVGLVKVFTQSAADFLDDWFESKKSR